jgi:hypothetical protein
MMPGGQVFATRYGNCGRLVFAVLLMAVGGDMTPAPGTGSLASRAPQKVTSCYVCGMTE